MEETFGHHLIKDRRADVAAAAAAAAPSPAMTPMIITGNADHDDGVAADDVTIDVQ